MSSYIVSNYRHNIQGVPFRHNPHVNANIRNDRSNQPAANQNQISISIIPSTGTLSSQRKMLVIDAQPGVTHMSKPEKMKAKSFFCYYCLPVIVLFLYCISCSYILSPVVSFSRNHPYPRYIVACYIAERLYRTKLINSTEKLVEDEIIASRNCTERMSNNSSPHKFFSISLCFW